MKKKSKGFQTRLHHARSPITRSLSVDLDQAVLNQFTRFHGFPKSNKEVHEGFSAVIPLLYASARSDSPCTPAILAMAWVTSAPFATVSQRMGAARRKYGEAVVKLRDALQDPCTARADDALFTVLFMLILEVPEPSFACFVSSANDCRC